MPEFSRPATYVDKLLFAQRTVKATQFRVDQKLAMRELCEAFAELLVALLDREQGREVKPDAGQAEQKPTP